MYFRPSFVVVIAPSYWASPSWLHVAQRLLVPFQRSCLGDGNGYMKGEYRMTHFKAKLGNGEIEIGSTVEGKLPAIERKIEIVDLRKSHHAESSAKSSRVP